VVEVAEILHISERQAYRLLATGNERVQIRDMETWTVSTAVEDGNSPEAIRYLLAANENVFWRRGAATYAWTLHQLKPELAPHMVSAFAGMHINVARRSGLDREVWGRILDLALVTEPWTAQENEDRFFDELHARNEPDLEFAAQVFHYLKGTATAWHGVIGHVGTVPDQVGWLRSRVVEIELEEKVEPGTVRLIETPGDKEPKKRKS
jgi:hypothetical protein